MRKYRCMTQFYVDSYDENGFIFNENGISVDCGSIWIDYEDDYRFIGGQVRLETENEAHWIEITKERVSENFVEIQPDTKE